MTEWNQFRNLDLPRLKTRMRRPLLLDLRNIYEPHLAESAGFHYEGVARGSAPRDRTGDSAEIDRALRSSPGTDADAQ